MATIRRLLGAREPELLPAQTAQQWLESVLAIDTSRCPGCGGPLSEHELTPVWPAGEIRDNVDETSLLAAF